MTTTTDLLETLRAHLAAFEVPALFSIRLTPSTVGPNVSAQLDGHHLTQIVRRIIGLGRHSHRGHHYGMASA
jgi:hypothetical protein